MEGDNPEPGGHPVALESSLLGVISWWLGRHTREEVLVLISRHFLPDEVREGNLLLAEACKLQEQPGHKTSILRSAGEAYAVDLVNNLDMLGKQKNAPRYLIPSDQLGKVPLGALNVRDEVSVGARLESLELSVKKVCSALQGVQANPPIAVTSRLDGLEESVRKVSSLLGQSAAPAATFASVAAVSGSGGRVPTLVVTPDQEIGHLVPNPRMELEP